MPETARVLAFRAKRSPEQISVADALRRAESFLGIPLDQRPKNLVDSVLGDPDVLTGICNYLRESVNTDPARVESEASQLFGWLSARSEGFGYFDERDYFLGESSLLAGSASRLLGHREETERWLDRADASFRHTINPAPHLARVSYIRLTLRYDMHRHEEVLELLPSLAMSFEKLHMRSELAKCAFLKAMSLKLLGRLDEAAMGLEALAEGVDFAGEDALRGMALLNLGNLRSSQGKCEVALRAYAQAQPLLQTARMFGVLADLKASVGETLDRFGQTDAALQSYRESVRDAAKLGLTTRTAYFRVVLADALVRAGRFREAEWELLAALPTLDREGMVPEGFVAVGLLNESVRKRKTDSQALAELRKYLETKA